MISYAASTIRAATELPATHHVESIEQAVMRQLRCFGKFRNSLACLQGLTLVDGRWGSKEPGNPSRCVGFRVRRYPT
ncbi:hypothetical protein MJO29_005747 [Puccinia striiformis f. sp. tritici]|nr:hypothetical protein MJO29_005747 [Puccinia striiformis f. sp. tritici]